MLKIQEIRISGFRGVPWKTIPFKLEPINSLVLFAQNSRGKSSIAEAVEFCFTEQLKAFSLTPGETAVTDLIHQNSTQGAQVVIKFIEDNGKTREEMLKLDKDGKVTNSFSTDLKELFKAEVGIINQHFLNEFLEETIYKRDEIFTSKVLNLPGLQEFGDGIEALTRNFDVDANIQKYDSEIESLNQLLIKIDIGKKELKVKITDVLNKFGLNEFDNAKIHSLLKDNLGNLDGLSDATDLTKQVIDWDSIFDKFAPSNSYLEEIKKREEKVNRFNKCNGLLDKWLIKEVTEIATLITLLKDKKNLLESITFDDLYEKSLEILDGKNLDKCPLCDQKLIEAHVHQPKTLIEYIKIKRGDFNEIRTAREDLKRKLDTFINKILEIIVPWEVINDYGLRPKIEALRNYNLKDDNLGDLERIKQDILNTNKDIKKIGNDLYEEINSYKDLKDLNESKRVNFSNIRQIIFYQKEIEDKSNDLINTSKQLNIVYNKKALLDTVKTDLIAFRDKYSQEVAELNRSILDEISCLPDASGQNVGLVQKYFRHLYPEHGDIIPYIEKRDKSLMLKVQFYGESRNVRAILSEGLKKAFLLSVWLANLKRLNKKLGFLIIDDVTNSLDQDHRCRFVELLQDEFPNLQKIIFTHDEFLFNYMRESFQGGIYQFEKIKAWTISTVLHDKEQSNYMGEVDNFINSGDKEAAALYLRLELERVISLLCNKYQIKVKFLKNPKDRKLEDLYKALKDKVTTGTNIVTQWPFPNSSQKEKWILNICMHYIDPNFTSVVPANITDCKKAVLELDNLFRCPTCSVYFRDISLPKKCNCVQAPVVNIVTSSPTIVI